MITRKRVCAKSSRSPRKLVNLVLHVGAELGLAVRTIHTDGLQPVGRIVDVGNRRLARIAKLAGAPTAPTAGIDLHVACGSRIEKGAPLFTLHAESPGELQYALDAMVSSPEIFRMEHE